jgi:hypothetical protein
MSPRVKVVKGEKLQRGLTNQGHASSAPSPSFGLLLKVANCTTFTIFDTFYDVSLQNILLG